ncbi:MAG: MlaD family protein, partial [Mucinivorans sp.]
SKQVLIGLFTVAILAGTYFGISFLKSKKIFSDDNIIYAVFPQADGLEVSSPVLIKGFRIGTVEKVSFNIKTSQVLVKMTVDGQYDLPVTSQAQITSTSILGGKVIEVKLGVESPKVLVSGDTIRSIFAPSITESMGEEYGKLKATANEIVEKLNTALDGINHVLSAQNVAALSATLSNLHSISGNIDQVVSKERDNIAVIIANLSTLSTSLKKMSPNLERGVSNFVALSDTLRNQAPRLISSAVGSIMNLNSILSQINSENGSLGKLVNDPKLYENLNETINSLTLLLNDLKANPKRYINVTIFGGKGK